MLLEEINNYLPINEQEQRDKINMLEVYDKYKDLALYRESTMAHFSASCWIVNKDFTKVLMTFHNIYKNWGWLGGHADGDSDLSNVAMKEAHEESGLSNISFVDTKPISLEILPVGYHIKKGKFVSAHLHLNLTYLMVADENEELKVKEDESSGLKWVALEDCVSITNEELMKPIYQKLVDRTLEYRKK